VLTFALDSKAELPPAPPPVIQAAPDPDYKPDAALAAKGAGTFGFNCGICHGPEAVSGGTAPDLRSSDMLSAADIFRAVVHDGTRVAAGMPSFSDLSESDIAAIRQYIRSQAADLRAGKAKVPMGEAHGG
jgi:quinohemoprotein ethanol dehydrogenase